MQADLAIFCDSMALSSPVNLEVVQRTMYRMFWRAFPYNKVLSSPGQLKLVRSVAIVVSKSAATKSADSRVENILCRVQNRQSRSAASMT